MQRLQQTRLAQLKPEVKQPGYDRNSIGVGIVHLGLGAFHRAHQAVYTDLAMSASGGDWGITGVSLRSDAVARQLRPQDGLFSVLSDNGESREIRLVGAVKNVLVATTQLDEIVNAIADSATRLVTMTITEKGYCLAADGHSLDVGNEQIETDLNASQTPRSAIGILALGLHRRQTLGNEPLTVISCDNLSENGRVIETVLTEYSTRAFPKLGRWIAEHVRFPSTMVDRIVPAITEMQQARQSQALGLEDFGAVATEPFSQWIIEDDFCTPRPDWQRVGVQFVDDIVPYENIKLRLLNASHSAIAVLGLLSGKDTVDAVIKDASLGSFVTHLMSQELMPALEVPAGFDLPAYRDQLLARFANPCLQHRCEQIATDSSEKIRQRWLPLLQVDSGVTSLQKVLSAWCYLMLQTDIAINDPRASQLLALRSATAGDRLVGVLELAGIDPDCVPDFASLQDTLRQNMNILARGGISALIEV